MRLHNRKNKFLYKINSVMETQSDILEHIDDYEQVCPNVSDSEICEYFKYKNIICMIYILSKK